MDGAVGLVGVEEWECDVDEELAESDRDFVDVDFELGFWEGDCEDVGFFALWGEMEKGRGGDVNDDDDDERKDTKVNKR